MSRLIALTHLSPRTHTVSSLGERDCARAAAPAASLAGGWAACGDASPSPFTLLCHPRAGRAGCGGGSDHAALGST